MNAILGGVSAVVFFSRDGFVFFAKGWVGGESGRLDLQEDDSLNEAVQKWLQSACIYRVTWCLLIPRRLHHHDEEDNQPHRRLAALKGQVCDRL